MDNEKQRQAQKEFHDYPLKLALDQAKKGECTVLFIDADHFVMSVFLGMVWSFSRILLPTASGRKRHNVLSAYDPIRHDNNQRYLY